MAVDEQRVEKNISELKKFLGFPRGRSTETVAALVERLRVEQMVGEFARERKAIYRAIIDLFEDQLEERYEKEAERESTKRSVLDYVRKYLDGM